MARKEGPYFCDSGNPANNKNFYATDVFPETFNATGGLFSQDTITGALRVVDFGMGRGAVGGLVRDLNPSCELIGVDSIPTYHGATYYDLYNRRVCVDLTDEDQWLLLRSIKNVDLIVSVGLPPHVIQNLIGRYQQIHKMLKQGGLCVLMSDFESTFFDPQLFRLYKTDNIIKSNLVYRKS